MYNTVKQIVTEVRTKRPLILNITNLVTMNFVANGLLSLGASPVMTQSMHEIGDLLQIAQCIVINLGTLNDEFVALCEKVCLLGNQLRIPIIFDPVGSGASRYRTEICIQLLTKYRFAILRGNASEIKSLSATGQLSKGVDSLIDPEDAIDSARQLSADFGVVVAITGKTDVIIDSPSIAQIQRGSELMPRVTGSGCLLTAVIAAFHAVHPAPYTATQSAIMFYGVCGELAADAAQGPGTFAAHFIDALSLMPRRECYDQD